MTQTNERLSAALVRLGLPGGEAATRATPLAGDVGQRRYFRVAVPGDAFAVLVLYPEVRSTPQLRWTALRAALETAGVRVPALLADAPEDGCALIEDLGSHDLAAEVADAPPGERPRLLAEAEELLGTIRSVDAAAARLNPPFDAAFFVSELDHTRHWALEDGGRSPLPPGRRERWDVLSGALAAAAADPGATGAPVPTHRDYHANNLMRAADGRLAVIDFQDLRLGPPDYDPVSLRFERAGESVPYDGPPHAEAVLLQRAWKVLGTFEKMLRLGRPYYAGHRDTARRVIRARTQRGGAWVPLLEFLP